MSKALCILYTYFKYIKLLKNMVLNKSWKFIKIKNYKNLPIKYILKGPRRLQMGLNFHFKVSNPKTI